jgi:hypothetical protein
VTSTSSRAPVDTRYARLALPARPARPSSPHLSCPFSPARYVASAIITSSRTSTNDARPAVGSTPKMGSSSSRSELKSQFSSLAARLVQAFGCLTRHAMLLSERVGRTMLTAF